MDIARLLNQDISLWYAGTPDMYGNPSYTLKQVKGRLEVKNSITEGENGTELKSVTEVYLLSSVSNGDYIYNGLSQDTAPPSDAYRVERCDVIPSISASQLLYKVTI